MLEQLREEADFPFSNCSFYRCAAHNKHVGGKPNSAHLLGCGVDIPVYGKKALRILELAPKYGFTGIGINQKGPHDKRFIHLDSLPSDNGFAPRPWIWTY